MPFVPSYPSLYQGANRQGRLGAQYRSQADAAWNRGTDSLKQDLWQKGQGSLGKFDDAARQYQIAKQQEKAEREAKPGFFGSGGGAAAGAGIGMGLGILFAPLTGGGSIAAILASGGLGTGAITAGMAGAGAASVAAGGALGGALGGAVGSIGDAAAGGSVAGASTATNNAIQQLSNYAAQSQQNRTQKFSDYMGAEAKGIVGPDTSTEWPEMGSTGSARFFGDIHPDVGGAVPPTMQTPDQSLSPPPPPTVPDGTGMSMQPEAIGMRRTKTDTMARRMAPPGTYSPTGQAEALARVLKERETRKNNPRFGPPFKWNQRLA